MEQCRVHGWQPDPDHIVFRARIFVAESREEAEDYRRALEDRPAGEHRVSRTTRYVEAVESARRSRAHFGFGPYAHFVGTPAEIVDQLRLAHDEAGIGVVDLAFDPPPTGDYGDGLQLHARLMRSVEIFGREVLPAMKEI
jgi:alkanesulfonate monooxygenase SsuD/methylene tetrahydromethanopterin reductase-like flavin-dependent oxidoreductase (luciferase family)